MAAPHSGSDRALLVERRRLLAGLAAGGMVSLAGCAGGKARAQRLEDVELGVSVMKDGLQAFFPAAGQERAPYRVKYALLPFDLSLQAIGTGTLDLGWNFSDIPLILWGGPLKDLRGVALIRANARTRLMGVVARPGLAVSSPADLRGRRVGFVRGTNYHYYLLRLLTEHGLEPKDIVPVNLDRDTLPAAFASGELDFWVTQNAETILAQRRYGGHVVALADGPYVGNAVVIANQSALDDPVKAKAIGDYLLRLRKVVDWTEHHDAEWAQTLGRQTGIEPSYFLAWRQYRTGPTRLVAVDDEAVKQQQEAAATFRAAGVIDKDFDSSGFWDRRYTALLA